MALVVIIAAGPLTSLQDQGRFGLLAAGLSASGPMDWGAARRALGRLARPGRTLVEFTAGLELELREGPLELAGEGGQFSVRINGKAADWPLLFTLTAGDRLKIAPGPAGTYGVLAFSGEIATTPVLGSTATNTIAGLGGALLRAGDTLRLEPPGESGPGITPEGAALPTDGPIRVIPGLHWALFEPERRARFLASPFTITNRRDRMGVRLADPEQVFGGVALLSLISEPVVAGDIQILGHGTPIVLMRDHQPLGGYPRLATIITADLDRFAQTRPGETIRFQTISVQHAAALLT
jgi:biotin-dependent carboxylase-like uncharacterized protein